MKNIYMILMIMLIALSACTTKAPETNEIKDTNSDDPSANDDVAQVEEIDDGVKDTDDAVEEADKDLDDLPTEEKDLSDKFCNPGDTYKYDSKDGDVNSIIIGLEMYKGKNFCKANSKSTINSPAGAINSDTDYYFNQEASEMWVVTTTSSSFMPAPQINEVHVVDGKVVN